VAEQQNASNADFELLAESSTTSQQPKPDANNKTQPTKQASGRR